MDTLDLSVENFITTEQINVLKRIERNIKRSDGEYALYFVECNLPNLRRQLIDKLESNSDINLLTLEIADYPKDQGIHIDEWISEQKKRYQNSKKPLSGINIIGLEHLLPTDSNEQIIQTVSELNWRRSYFQALAVPIIFWLPRYALNLLTSNASDFYDWYSDIYHFDSDSTQKSFAISQQMTSLRHPKSHISAHQYLSKQEKEQQLRQLNALLDETNNINDIAHLKNQMGLLLYSIGLPDKALVAFQDAYLGYQKIGYKSGEAGVLSNISQVLRNQGKNESALDSLKKSLNIINKDSNKSGLAVTLNNLGQVYHDLGELEKALEYYERSLALCVQAYDKIGIGSTLNNIASIYHTRGDNANALKYFKSSLNICKEIDDKLGLSNLLGNIGILYHQDNDNDTALSYFKDSLKVCTEIGDDDGIAEALSNIGNIYKDQGNLASALEYFEKSLAIDEKIKNETRMILTLNKIAQIYVSEENYSEAIKYLENAIDICEKSGNKESLAYLSYNLGYVLQITNTGLSIENNTYLQKSYVLAKELGLDDILSEIP